MLEIERKFLVDRFPDDLIPIQPPSKVEQGYLSTDPNYEVRVSNRFNLTTKRGVGLIREEVVLPISEEAFKALWLLTERNRIYKDRYLFVDGGHTIEVDVYKDNNAGLVVAEVEFPLELAAFNFKAPSWFGREITDERQYANSTLSFNKTSRFFKI